MTKELRYIQIQENDVRESVKNQLIEVKDIAEKINPENLFYKRRQIKIDEKTKKSREEFSKGFVKGLVFH